MNSDHDIEQDLSIINRQEEELQFQSFDLTDAWQLGVSLREQSLRGELPVAIEIRLASETVFLTVLPGAGPVNVDWARRKRNTCELFRRSSYAIGLECQRTTATLQEQLGLELRDFAIHGGSFPIKVKGVGFIGCVTVSGLPQRKDHNLIVTTIASRLAISLEGIVLP